MAPKPSRDTLIHCDACGEDYSSTYRRCPFCGARNKPNGDSRRAPRQEEVPYEDDSYEAGPAAPEAARQDRGESIDDGYVFDGQSAFDDLPEDEGYYDNPHPKGGKRLAPKQGGGIDLPPINWPRLITFLCSLVIIVAALVIVFTVIYPQLRGNEDKDPATADSAEVSSVPSRDPVNIITPNVGFDVTDAPASADPGIDPTDQIPPAQPEVTGITLTSNGVTLRANDITLHLGESAQMGAVISPSGWTGPVTWTSSNPEWITVSDSGLVTNVNNTGAFHNAFLTVTAGGMTVRCEVRVRSVRADSSSTPAPTTQAPDPNNSSTQAPAVSTGGNPAVGSPGTIVDADGGLRVRSGPGTEYEVLASLTNGTSVNVLEDAGNGWYKITFQGRNETVTGYVKGDYVSSN